jgi:hypothetical protein
MMAGLSPASRRLLAVALLLVPLVASVLLVAVPVQLGERHSAALVDLEEHIGRLEQRLVTREQVLAELRQLERTTELDPRLLNAETVGVAGATLAGRLADQLQAAGGWLESTQVLEPVLDPPLMRIAVRLRGEIELAGLRSLLHGIENAEPVLTVERIALRNDDIGDRSGQVVMELTVVGYARAGLNATSDGGREQPTQSAKVD